MHKDRLNCPCYALVKSFPAVSIFTARRYASSGTSYGPVSVRLRLSQVGVPSKLMDESGFVKTSMKVFPPILHCVIRKLGYLQNKGISLWKFVPISGIKKFRYDKSIL